MVKSFSWIAAFSQKFAERIAFDKLRSIAIGSAKLQRFPTELRSALCPSEFAPLALIAPLFPIGMIVPLVLSFATAANAQFIRPTRSSIYTVPRSNSVSGISPYSRTVIIQRPFANDYYQSTFGQPVPIYPGVRHHHSNNRSLYPSTVIVTPSIRTRTVIINPSGSYNGGFYRGRSYNNGFYGGASKCSTAIYGSPIPSPVPVNPYTGLACR